MFISKIWRKNRHRRTHEKYTLSKKNENPMLKMIILLRSLRQKRKLLKYHCFLRHVWRTRKRMCAKPQDSLCQNAHDNTNKFRSEIHFSEWLVLKFSRFTSPRNDPFSTNWLKSHTLLFKPSDQNIKCWKSIEAPPNTCLIWWSLYQCDVKGSESCGAV